VMPPIVRRIEQTVVGTVSLGDYSLHQQFWITECLDQLSPHNLPLLLSVPNLVTGRNPVYRVFCLLAALRSVRNDRIPGIAAFILATASTALSRRRLRIGIVP
jgi:hypothetical protein